MRRLGFIVLVLILVLSLFYVQLFDVPVVEASTVYQGDLVLSGNNVTIIEGRFDINGSISVEGNATLILKNAYLNWSQSEYYPRHIYFWYPSNGNPRLIAYNSTITRYSTNKLSFYHNSTAIINNSTINCEVDISSSSPISISNNSNIDATVYARQSSVINVTNSRIKTLYDQIIDGQISNSQIDQLYTQSTSVNSTISNLEPGLSSYWSFRSNCSVDVLAGGYATNLKLTNTNVNKWSFIFYGNSNIAISNSNIRYASAQQSSILSLNSTTIYQFSASASTTCTIENSFITYNSYFTGSTHIWMLNTTCGDLYPWDTSVVNIYNCTIDFYYCKESSENEFYNSEILRLAMAFTSVEGTISKLEPRLFVYWSLRNNSSLSPLVGGSAPNVTLTNTKVDKWLLDFYGNSSATVSNSMIDYVYAREMSVLSFNSSTNWYAYAGDSSLLFIENSDFNEIRAYGSSIWWLLNTTYNSIQPDSSGKVYLDWYLDVHVEDSVGQVVPSASVTVSYPNSTVVDSKLTDEYGLARFQLMEKMVNATGEYPVGNYTVEAAYDTYLASTTVNMTGTQQLTLPLEDFVIPEFSSLILISTLIIATLAAIIVGNNKSKK